MEELSPLELSKQVEEKTIKAGFYGGCPSGIYHLMPGLSSSLAKVGINNSLAHLRAEMVKPFDPIENLGTIAHAMTLEPDETAGAWAEKLNGKTNEGKEQLKKAKETRTLLAYKKDIDAGREIARSVHEHPLMGEILEQSEKEISGLTTHVVDGVKFVLKIRPDMLIRNADRIPTHGDQYIQGPCILDLKTCSAKMSEFALGSMARAQGWYVQAAFYQWVTRLITGADYTFYHVFAETKAPFGVRIRQVPQAAMDQELERIEAFLPRYVKALTTGEWPNYDLTITETMVPGYHWGQDDFMPEGGQ